MTRGTTIIENIGKLVSGDINNPILNGDTVVIQDGKIREVGYSSQVDKGGASVHIDANGKKECSTFHMCIAPYRLEP